MRLVSPYSVLVFIVVWTIVFLLASRQFLFSAHQVSLWLSTVSPSHVSSSPLPLFLHPILSLFFFQLFPSSFC